MPRGKGITAKQEAFARNVIKGMSPSEAYRAAGYRATGATAATEAARLMRNPHVAPVIEEGRNRAMSQAVWSRKLSLERMRAVNDALFDAITEGGSTDQGTLRAFLETSAKLDDMANVEHELITIRYQINQRLDDSLLCVKERSMDEIRAIYEEFE